MKIAFIGTYPPRECGIGTFTQNLAKAILTDNQKEDEIVIIAINDHDSDYEYHDEVKFTIRQQEQEDYRAAADFINTCGADICILQHEYGIYGGNSGIYILQLLHRLKIPMISTLHTILDTPSYNEKVILRDICKIAEKVVVMSHKAVQFLIELYNIPRSKVTLIEHGLPDIQVNKSKARKELNLEGKDVLLTFGFIGRSKGIETVIKGLPKISRKNPNVLYIVLGKTHPNVLRDVGEEYRIQLHDLAAELDVEDHVLFLNKFIDEDGLFKYLAACDIYITPYLSVAQITSGTLTYAMGSGCAVVSTRYWHAAELLADDRGCFFDFNDSEGLADVIIELFENPEKRQKIQEKALAYGRNMIWPRIGMNYFSLILDVLSEPKKSPSNSDGIDLNELPPLLFTHIRRLTDQTGIIQHALFGIPNFKEGYCLDDNSRALLMVAMHYKHRGASHMLDLMTIYLSFIHFMQKDDGNFYNFLSYNRNYMEEVGSEDSFGRTIWALGYVYANSPLDAYRQLAISMFRKAIPNFHKLRSIRAIASSIIGSCYYLKVHASDNGMKQELRNMVTKLISEFSQNQGENWSWFESLLAYDNGILPLALLHATEILKEKDVADTAFKAMNFLVEHTFVSGHLSIIGNDTWYKKDQERSMFAQQPLDAQAMVLMFHQAFKLTGKTEYLDKLFICFKWFLGENDMNISLYNFETKGCADGFEKYGVNQNQGAESTLAYLISYLTVLEAYEESFHIKSLDSLIDLKILN